LENKAVVFINQFFGQIGGEEAADHEPIIKDGAAGAAQALDAHFEGEIVKTIISGDNYVASNQEEASERIIDLLEGVEFDIIFAGPAFQAGRYGQACGTVGKAVKEKFDVPAVSSMHEENPGVDLYKKHMYIFPGGDVAARMQEDAEKMARFGNKLLQEEGPFLQEEEGFFKRGKRHQYFLPDETPAADRAIEMLLKKLNDEEYTSELPIPELDTVDISPAIENLSEAEIALVTSGGIVPVENPDQIQSASATRWGKYDISGLDRLGNRDMDAYRTIHAGYDPAAADKDPNRVVPVDAMRHFEKEGRIGKLHDYFYSTVGTGTTEGEAARMGQEIAEDMKNNGVEAVILTAT